MDTLLNKNKKEREREREREREKRERERKRNYNNYLRLFKGQTESYRHIRVVFTGCQGAGKTTLCRRLQNISVDITSRQPTLGADLYPVWFGIKLGNKIWRKSYSPTHVMKERMGAVMSRSKTASEALDKYPDQELFRKYYNEAHAVNEFASSVDSSDVAYLSLWDMGGHEAFQSSHNIFISSHGVYLLVFRLTDFLRDKQETDRLKKWIRLIGTFSSDELNAPKFKTHAPPIIFVGTFLDELKKSSMDYEKDIEVTRMSISEFPELSDLHFVKFCTVDNSLENDDTEREELRGLITEAAVQQDQWERQIPTTWLKLEQDIFNARENGRRILALADVIEMNKSSIAPLKDEAEIKFALEYLHCTRSVIYFRDLNFVITDPKWLADFFAVFITDDRFLPTDDLVLLREIKLYKTKREFTPKMIELLLSREKNKTFLPHQSELFALMERFGLIVKVKMSKTVLGQTKVTETMVIPSKLKELGNICDVTNKVESLKQQPEHISKTLCFVFNNMSNELMKRILAGVMKEYKLASLPTRSVREATADSGTTSDDSDCLYNGFVCFKIDDTNRLILSMHEERSTIAMTVFRISSDRLSEAAGRQVRLSFEQIIKETLQMSNQQHYEFTHKLHCNFVLSPYDTPVHLHGVISSEKGVPCKGGDCHGKHILSKTDITFWGIQEDSADARYALDVSKTGDDTILTNRRPTPRELGRLSRLVDPNLCEMLFVNLGLPYPDVKHTEWENRSLAGITTITKMFLKWTNTYPNHTYNHIVKAMTEADMATNRFSEVVESHEDSENIDGLVSMDVWKRAPSDEEKEKIVGNIGKAYFNLFLELGLSPPTIEQQEVRFPTCVESRLLALLQCWVNQLKPRATVGRLLTAMKIYQMEWHKTAEIWSPCPENVCEASKS